MRQQITIKAVRRLTSATVLPDGTLVKFFRTERADTHESLSCDCEVVEGYVERFEFRHPDYSGWQAQEGVRQHVGLSVACRYPEDDGYLPLLKGSRVMAQFCHVSNGSQNTQAMGVKLGHIRVRNPRLGAVTFTIMQGLSADLEPFLRSEALPTFAQIKADGSYGDYKVVKVTEKPGPKLATRETEAA